MATATTQAGKAPVGLDFVSVSNPRQPAPVRGKDLSGCLVERSKSVREPERFGCRHCWPSDAKDAWKARGLLEREVDLVDESHFHVMILACRACAQRFVSVFTETIDWKEGDDAQFWSLMPITDAERTCLSATPSETELNRLGFGRQCLKHDHPTGERADTRWGFWVGVGRHD